VLLEVLAALVVLGLALGALAQALSGGVAATEAGAGRGRAVLAAQSVLALLESQPLAEGARTGTLDGMAWRAQVVRSPLDPQPVHGLPVLMQVTVEVAGIRLSTLALQP
jgi:hypothetical protein